MARQCMVAVYDSRDTAEQAYRAVREAGVPEDHIRLSDRADTTTDNSTGATDSTRTSEPGFLDWLFGSGVPEEHQHAYASRFSQGHAALSVYVDDAPSIAGTSNVESILEQYHPVDLQFDTEQQASTPDKVGEEQFGSGSQTEQVIPLPEEELKVGKRATEQVKRVRTYVVQEPVQQNVTLHDERVVIERRPSTTATAGEPVEREYEIREHHEEPVVEKQTKAGEEIVVRKEESDRTEQIRDTVKKTKADIDTAKRK